MKYLIVGLGNIGSEYANTRHNIGFMTLDKLAATENLKFTVDKQAYHTEWNFKSRSIHLIKPTTYMNLSGKALNYWMQYLKIPHQNVLVIVDELALPFAKVQLKPKGGNAGHNGLKSIEEAFGSQNYARIRMGIGNDFGQGQQVKHVLGEFKTDEQPEIPFMIDKAIEMIKSFTTAGIELTMTRLNK